MENNISVTITPLQLLLSLAFQIWMVVFPILIIKKLNRISQLLENPRNSEEEEAQ